MNYRLDPMTGRLVPMDAPGYDPRFAGLTPQELDATARNARPPGLFSFGADPVPPGVRSVLQDNQAAPAFVADAQREVRNRGYAAAPPSPRPFMGPGDGAAMFPDNPMAPGVQQPPVAAQPPFVEPPPNTPGMAMQPDPSLPVPPIPPGQTPRPAAAPVPQQPPAQPQGVLAAPTAQPRPQGQPDDIDAFLDRIAVPESSGRPGVRNSGGFAGLYQFGAPRLATLGLYTPGPNENLRQWATGGGRVPSQNQWTGTFNIPGFENVRTIDDFLANPDAQRAAGRIHVQAIDQTIGRTPGAEAFNRNGLRAAAHLGGDDGMASFVARGGQGEGAVDGNGTSIASYYRRLSGSDAPPGAAGRMGGTAPPQPDATPTEKPPVAAREPGVNAPGVGMPNFMGIPANALIAAGAGMLSGQNPMDGLGRAGSAFVQQANAAQQFEQSRQDRAEMRADRRDNAAQTAEFRRAQLAIARQRADQAGARGPNSAATPFSFDGTTYRSEDGTLFRQRQNRATGAVEWLDQQNRVVPPDQVPQRLTRVQDTGERSLNDGVARDAADAAQNAFNGEASLRTLRQATANARDQLQRNPQLTGASWRQQAGRYLATALGIPVDGKSPDEIAAIEQALMAGQTQQIIQMGQHLRPMSNVDLQAVLRQVPSVASDPRLLPAWLDQIDAAATRAERATRAFDELWRTREGRQVIISTGGVDAWFARYHRENSTREPGGAVQPNLERTGPPGTSGEWRFRTPSGVGFSFN